MRAASETVRVERGGGRPRASGSPARGLVERYWAVAAVLVMTLVASIVRLRYGLGARLELETPDGSVYQAAAEDMLRRGVFAEGVPDIPYYPAGYAVLLTAIYDVFGLDMRAVEWVQVVMLAIATLSLYAVVAREFSRGIGVLTVLFVCANPVLAPASTRVMYETPLMFCLILALDFASRGAHADGARAAGAWTATGCFFIGLGTALQPKVLPIGLFLIAWVLVRRRAGGRRSRRPGAAIAVVSLIALALGPAAQVVRNGVADGHYILAANTGVNLAGGLNDLASGRYDEAVLGAVYEECGADPKVLVEWDRKLTQCAVEWLVTHPKRTVELTYPKFWNLWGGFIGPTTPPTRWRAMPIDKVMPKWLYTSPVVGNGAVGYAGTAVVVLASLAGVAIGLFRRRLRAGTALLLAPIVMILGLSLLTWAEPRYRIPASPFYSAFAALAVVALARRWLRRGRWPLLAVDAGVAVTVVALLARPMGFRLVPGLSPLQWAGLIGGPLLAAGAIALLRRRPAPDVTTVVDKRPSGPARWLFAVNVGFAAITLAYHAEDFGFASSPVFGWKQKALFAAGVLLCVAGVLALALDARRSGRRPAGMRVPLAIAAVQLLVFVLLVEPTATIMQSTVWNHPVMPTTTGAIVIALAAALAGRAPDRPDQAATAVRGRARNSKSAVST